MLVLPPRSECRAPLVMAGLVGPLVALPLIFAPAIETDTVAEAKAAKAGGRAGAVKSGRTGCVFTPAILGMMVFLFS